MPLSVAAACSSKLNERQNRLRSARPQALLMRAPNGAWMTSCMPPPSSKNRSAMIVSPVGTAPRTVRPHTTYSTICSAPRRSRPHEVVNHPIASRRALGRLRARHRAGRASRGQIADRLAHFRHERGELGRAGRRLAAPERDGRRGAVRVLDDDSPAELTRRMRHDVLPSSITSPAMLSTAKSSSTVPTTVPSGSATTV